MEIVNLIGHKLPETGSSLMFPLVITGIGLMLVGRKKVWRGVKEDE